MCDIFKLVGEFMKFKKIYYLFILLLILCVSSGCSKQDKSLKVSDMENRGYKLYYEYDVYGSTYDKDGNCYSTSYEKDDCVREIFDDDGKHTVEFVKSNGEKNGTSKFLKFSGYYLFGSISDLNYTDDNDNYLVYVYSKEKEYVRSGYSCYYEIRNKPDDTSMKECTGEDLKKAEEFADNYKKTLKKLHTDSGSILKLMNEVSKDIVTPRMRDLIIKEPLSVDEFVKYIKRRGYTIKHLDDSVGIVSSNSTLSSIFGELYFTFDKKDNIKVMYYATSDSSKMYVIDYTSGDEFVMFKDSPCRYNVHDSNLSKNCTDDEKTKGWQWYFSFKSLIKSFRLEPSKLPEYIKMYAQKY